MTCVRIEAYEHQNQIILNSQQIIPVAEAEEYMTKRREKEEEQQPTSRGRRTITVLLEQGTLETGDIVQFPDDQISKVTEYDDDEEFWRGKVTGNSGRRETSSGSTTMKPIHLPDSLNTSCRR